MCAHRIRAEMAFASPAAHKGCNVDGQPYSAHLSANHRDVAFSQDQVPARCPDFVLPSPSRPIKFKAVCLGSTVFIS